MTMRKVMNRSIGGTCHLMQGLSVHDEGRGAAYATSLGALISPVNSSAIRAGTPPIFSIIARRSKNRCAQLFRYWPVILTLCRYTM